MRPVREIDPEFFASDEPFTERLPLLDEWLSRVSGARPFEGLCVLLVQHQLSNKIPMLRAMLDLGLDPKFLWWLDIPYTSRRDIREYAKEHFGVPGAQLAESDFQVLSPYAVHQHARAVDIVCAIAIQSDRPLLVMDDGAYVLEALAMLSAERRPKRVAIVEQTTRGFIKIERNAMLRHAAKSLPIIDVARSVPKRTLEPPFIAMAVCAALQSHLDRHFGAGLDGRILVLGYGAIGEQVTSFVRHRFELPHDAVHVHDVSPDKAALARRRGYPSWDTEDFDQRFSLVVGCSGQTSFNVGDAIFLEDGALLASASSGSVELSRQEFIELADSSALDDIEIDRTGFSANDVHADIPIRLVDRRVAFVNGGFPVNFDGSRTSCPTRFIQATSTMLLAASLQAADALRTSKCGILELDRGFCDWLDPAFRSTLGPRADWLLPVPDSAW